MTHTPSKILHEYLVAQGYFSRVNISGSWPLWNSFFPDSDDVQTPDDAAAVYDEPPQLDARQMSTGDIQQHFGVSIELRSTTYNTGWLKMFGIMEDLAKVHDASVTVDAATYTLHTIVNQSGVVSMGLERGTRRRNMFSMNLLITLTEN